VRSNNPAIRSSRSPLDESQAITAIYTPAGQLVVAHPVALPGVPLAPTQLLSPPASDAFRTSPYAGGSFRILVRPVPRDDGVWQVVVGQNLSAVDEAQGEVRHVLIIAVPILLGVLGVGAWLLSGAALRPVKRMSADAQRLSEHDADGRISEPPTRDSLNQLARTFNALLDRLHRSLDTQRGLVADAGHELRTPLAVLRTELETAVRPHRTREDLVDSINHARVEVERLASLAEDLLLLAQADGGQPLIRRQLCDVSDVLDAIEHTYLARAAQQSVTLTVDRPRPFIANLDPVALHRILDNVMTNALRHTPADGRITIEAGLQPDRPNGTPTAEVSSDRWPPAQSDIAVRVRVSDTGPGFPPDFLPHAFDRFSRADQGRSRSSAAAGSGLGLAIVQTLVHAHAGTVTLKNTPRGGALVEVCIPADAQPM
jgi:two-component system OmpR family sensor kinase